MFQILFLIYFFGGMAVMKYRGASGFELIPNFYFWSSLPGNLKVHPGSRKGLLHLLVPMHKIYRYLSPKIGRVLVDIVCLALQT